jgi:hypothetical protein
MPTGRLIHARRGCLVDQFIQLCQQAQQRFDARLAVQVAIRRHRHVAARWPLAVGAGFVQARQEYLRQPVLERHAIVDAEGRVHRARWPTSPSTQPSARSACSIGRPGPRAVFRTRPAQGIEPAHDAAQ